MRAAVELAKDWRTDKYLRNLEALMIVADKDVTLILTGNGDVLEPENGIAAIGSGGNYALSAARALVDYEPDAETDLPQGDGDRRRGLRLHQRPADDRDARQRRPDSPSAAGRGWGGLAGCHTTAALTPRPTHPRPLPCRERGVIENERRPHPESHRRARSTSTSSARPTPSAPSPSRCATAGAASSLGADLRDEVSPEEHPDDRPDRLRQDRDQPPPRQAGRRAVREGRGDQVHRGRLCRPRRRADRPRSGRGSDPAGDANAAASR